MKNCLFIVFMILVFHLGYTQQTDFEIRYSIEQSNEKLGEMEHIDSDAIAVASSVDLLIQLHDNGSFTNGFGNGFYIYHDLEKEMILSFSNDTLYNAVPLYSVIDYRVAEYNNRFFLKSTLEAEEAGNMFGDLVNLESIFGIEHPGDNVRDSIDVKTTKNSAIYSKFGDEIVHVRYSKTEVPKIYLGAFAKYLTYKLEIHPSIQEDIIKTKLVPEYIQFSYKNVGVKSTKTYELVNAEKVNNAPTDIYSKKRFSFQRNAANIGGIIDFMMNYTLFNEVKQADSTLYFKEAKELSDKGENLSGLLRLLEYLLTTDIQPTQQLREIVSKQKTDPQLASFLRCMSPPQTKMDAELKISILNELIETNVEFGYVMNIFVANYIEQENQNQSVDNFYKALSKNPYITGVWLDLGKIFVGRYQYDDAWKCYGVMLNLNSNHTLAKEVAGLKANLKKNYPAYFLVD